MDDSGYRHQDLQRRILSRLKAAETEGQLLKVLRDGFEAALEGEVLS
jgi:hypothetical protein